jgi:hypothetical protein
MSDKEIAMRALDYEKRAQDYSLISIPDYLDWSSQKIDEGESPAFIAHLDATAMCLLPEELASVGPEVFQDLLDDLKDSLGE